MAGAISMDKILWIRFLNDLFYGRSYIAGPGELSIMVVLGALVLRNPITGIADCCARAASGHAATPLPTNAMKSRRLMGVTPRSRITELSIAGVGVGQWRASQ